MITEQEKKVLKALGAEIIDDINVKDINVAVTTKYNQESVIVLNSNALVIKMLNNVKDSMTPSILKVKSELNSNNIYILNSALFSRYKNEIIKKGAEDIRIIDHAEEEEEDNFDTSDADKLLYDILFSAKVRGASDIHILPKDKKTIIKFRENGSLVTYKEFNKNYSKYLINRIKTKADLNITNQQTPQDGKFRAVVDKETLEIRVSTANTIFGENAVLRVQQTTSLFSISLDSLGFEEDELKAYRKSFTNPYGMILNVGATGQGKTTTFYLTINELFEIYPDKNISTVEDPVEIQFENAVQFEVNEKRELTFSVVLKALLRQDPDIILIGEIRDEETAAIAIKAAMTGHLVLATLHATDASNAFPRLKDIGISPQQISSTVSCVLSQRLVRRLCKCKKEVKVSDFIRKEYNIKVDTIYEANGCHLCNNSGFSDRGAIIEVMIITEKIKTALADNKTEIDLKKIAQSEGFVNLWKNGIKKVERGELSIAELERVVKKDSIYDTNEDMVN